jgi:hypothetical protein
MKPETLHSKYRAGYSGPKIYAISALVFFSRIGIVRISSDCITNRMTR